MSLLVFKGSLELGIIYAIMALGVFISFRTLNMPDLTVDGSFVLGAAVSAVLCTQGLPVIALPLAFLAGSGAGCITAWLHTKMKIQPLLAGILTMLALYSINLRVMLKRANIPLTNEETLFTWVDGLLGNSYGKVALAALILLLVLLLLFLFLKTKLGFVLRATGDNPHMVRALGVNTDFTILLGLALSNGLVAVSGAVVAQYQSFADVSMGTGMVVIGLASVIVGEVIFGTRTLLRRLTAVILGAVLYRLVIAFALEQGMPPTDLKLTSAAIVALALSMTTIQERLQFYRRRWAAKSSGGGEA